MIQDLEDAATRYAELRDERMELTTKEVALKGELLGLMRKHKKRHYERDGIEIEVVDQETTVKVRVAKPKEEEAAGEE